MRLTADDLHRRAVELSIGGRHALARRELDRAEARTVDPDLRARITGTRAYIFQMTGAPDEAVRLCKEALSVAGLAPHTRAVLAGQLGALAAHAGRLDEADRWLSQAIADLADDPVAAARTRMNRSLVGLQRRRLVAAIEDLEAAVHAFRDAGLATDEAQARHNLGYTSLLAGDLVAALEEMAAARPFAATSPVAAAIGDVDRAEALLEAGLTGDAERILAQTATVFGAHRMQHARAESELQLARSLLIHDPAAARRVAAASSRRFRLLHSDAWAARAEAVLLRADLSGGRLLPAGTRMSSAARAPTFAEVEAVATALIRRGFPNEAASLRLTRQLWLATNAHPTDEALPAVRVPSTASMSVRLLAREVRAARALARGRHAQARRYAADGLDELDVWRAGFASVDLNTSAAMHSTGLLAAGLEAALRSGRPDVVFDWSERARHASAQMTPVRPPPDPDLARDLAQLRMIRSSGAEWMSDPRARELQERVRRRQWSAGEAESMRGRVSLPALRDALGERTAMVAFVFTGDAMRVLVADRQSALLRDVDWSSARRCITGLRSDLDMAASIRGPMGQVVRHSLDARLVDLSEALFGDVDLSRVDRVVLTAPGVLGGLPWNMLPALRGRATTLAISASRWAAERVAPRPPGVAGFAVGPRIARGAEEAERAAAAWTAARTHDPARVNSVLSLAAEVDVLHIAAHGRHSADNPMFSGVELSDGTLFGYDVDLIPRVPQTVVLSACEAGRSSVRWGEEAIGMARIWLHAGTRCVIAAPVVVADDDACELLAAMHEGLAAGEEPAVALAAASARTGIVAPFQAHGSGF